MKRGVTCVCQGKGLKGPFVGRNAMDGVATSLASHRAARLSVKFAFYHPPPLCSDEVVRDTPLLMQPCRRQPRLASSPLRND